MKKLPLISIVTQELEERARQMKQRIIRQAEGSMGPASDSESYRLQGRRDRSREQGIPQDRLERDFDLRRGRDLERAHNHIRRRKGTLSRLVEKPTMWFSNMSDTTQPVQSQKQARSLKSWS